MSSAPVSFAVIAPRAFEHARGLHWSGILTADGQPVCRFENRGDGGQCCLDWKPGCDRKAFERALRAMAKDECEDEFEAEDVALGMLWDAAMMAGGK